MAMAGVIAACAVVPALLAGASAVVRAAPEPQHRQAATRSSRPLAPSPAQRGDSATTTGSAFRVAAMRHYGAGADASGYSVIVPTGPHQAWLLGGTNPGGPSAPVAASWNGSVTSTATLPPGLTSFISDGSATSAADVWAASEYGRYVLHFDGAHWRVARRWPSGKITGLTAVTPDDVWVFGTAADGTSDLGTWHFDGTSWRQVRGLAGSVVRASTVSASDIWAVSASPAAYSILRFDGRTWRPVPTGSSLDRVQPNDILALSPRDVWVLGDTASAAGVRLVLMHWNGGHWSRLETPISAWAGRLAAGADGTVLVSATPASASASGLIMQAAADPGGVVVSTPSALSGGVSDVVLAGGGHELWASGAVLNRLGGSAVVWTGQLPPPDDGIGT